ncbi:hypothetical protein Javan94_0028 [Streptococcus phage Javan94]|nr:hypothetical protein Javan94_0028 [Streptococcus phage Javan94]
MTSLCFAEDSYFLSSSAHCLFDLQTTYQTSAYYTANV